MGTVPQCQDYPALARRSHAPARADLDAGPGCPQPASGTDPGPGMPEI